MALQIIISADIHDLGMPEALQELSANIPPPPPLPKLPAKLQSYDSDSIDSGHVGSMLFIWDALPGVDLSDSEFSEEFSNASDISAASSRRGSETLQAVVKPIAPPPPPLPGYLANIIPAPPPLPAYLRNIPQQPSSLPSSFTQTVRARRYSLDSLDSYESDYDYDEDEHDDQEIDTLHEELLTGTCIVCYEERNDFKGGRKCCGELVCKQCMEAIARTNINEGLVFIKCPNPQCENGVLGREEILTLIQGPTKDKFVRLRLEVEGDGTKKACPNCSHITEHNLPKRYRRYREEKVRISCTQCQHVWCFSCHAPWHEGLTCKQHRRGNVQFKKWTHERSRAGVANCQRCPLCNVFIQRSTGCDHMTCNRCDTHFCYKCGGRFLEFPGLGDHYRRTSILGCKYNYKANSSSKRFAVRGGYFGAKMAALTGYPILFVAGAVIVVAVGAVALPIYGGYRYYKYRKNLKRRYGRRRRH